MHAKIVVKRLIPTLEQQLSHAEMRKIRSFRKNRSYNDVIFTVKVWQRKPIEYD